jgi:hypothetical protein
MSKGGTSHFTLSLLLPRSAAHFPQFPLLSQSLFLQGFSKGFDDFIRGDNILP